MLEGRVRYETRKYVSVIMTARAERVQDVVGEGGVV